MVEREVKIIKESEISPLYLYFLLKGNHGAVQFIVMADWFRPGTEEKVVDTFVKLFDDDIKPYGIDVGCHSTEPLYNGQLPTVPPGKCKYVPEGHPCYYDGSTSMAREWVKDILLERGSDGIWEALEDLYYEKFGSYE